MTARKGILIAALSAAVVLVAVGGWWFFIRDDAPPPLTLEDAVASTAAPGETSTTAPATTVPRPTDTSSNTTAATTAPTDPSTSGDAPADNGAVSWAVDPAGSVVGYRIEEELAGIGGTTAVGRTSDVGGSLVLDGATIVSVDVVVDMTTLQSDDSRRDGQLRRRGLETNSFPEAQFALIEPIDLGSLPAVGERVEAIAVGELVLHGVTRQVEIALEGQFLDESTIVVVGSTEIVLADYDIEAPTGLSVLSVADAGLLELQLTFRS